MASLLVLKTAVPLVKALLPSVEVPSLNVTVPVGAPEVLAFTVAVNFTVCPADEGFGEDVSEVEVDALFTVCFKTADVLGKKLTLPP